MSVHETHFKSRIIPPGAISGPVKNLAALPALLAPASAIVEIGSRSQIRPAHDAWCA